MTIRLDVKSQVLTHYVRQSNIPIDYLQSKVKDISLFLNGEKNPTFSQLSTIAKTLNIPTGLLLLSEPIKVVSEEINFRTLDSKNLESASPELRDTVLEMQVKQDFLREEVEDTLEFIGGSSISEDYMDVVYKIRKYLNISTDYYKKISKDSFSFFRNRINNMGVFVFLNGKVRDNTHRPLDLEEFRGFALSDKKAPIIFINQIDSKNGQTFTLIHELVHLFLNINEIYSLIETETYKFDPVETFVNKVTAEILVPREELIQQDLTDLDNLAKKFCVSKFVIVRRLLDLNFLTKEEYEIKVSSLKKEFSKVGDISKTKKSGGNYNNNVKFRIDTLFFQYVENAISQNRLSYTDAFGIIGVGYKGYKILRGREK